MQVAPALLHHPPRLELYDIAADPGETKDLATGRPEIVDTMKRQCDAWFTDVAARWHGQGRQARGLGHRAVIAPGRRGALLAATRQAAGAARAAERPPAACRLGPVCRLPVVAGLLVAGCAGDGEPVCPVSDQILLDGQPLAEAAVVFHPQAGKRRSLTSHTDREGRFKLTTYAPDDGAPAGAYLVTVEYRDRVQEGDDWVRSGPNRLPPRYAQPEDSGLNCEVVAGANELPAWNLARR